MIRINPPPSSTSTPPDPALRKAAQAFEAIMLRQIISTMRAARLAEPLLQSSATDQFRELADKNMADVMAERGAFGIASMIERQFSPQKGAPQ